MESVKIAIVGKCKGNPWDHMDHTWNWRGDKRALYEIGLNVWRCGYAFQGFAMCLHIVLRNIVVSNIDITSFVACISNKLISRLWCKGIVFPSGGEAGSGDVKCVSAGGGLDINLPHIQVTCLLY